MHDACSYCYTKPGPSGPPSQGGDKEDKCENTKPASCKIISQQLQTQKDTKHVQLKLNENIQFTVIWRKSEVSKNSSRTNESNEMGDNEENMEKTNRTTESNNGLTWRKKAAQTATEVTKVDFDTDASFTKMMMEIPAEYRLVVIKEDLYLFYNNLRVNLGHSLGRQHSLVEDLNRTGFLKYCSFKGYDCSDPRYKR